MSPSQPPPVPGVPPPAYKLFDSASVGIATFFGSPLAGAILMAKNYSRLGKAGAAQVTLVLGTLGTAVLLALAYIVDNAVIKVLPLAIFLAVKSLATSLQGKTVEQHTRNGGGLVSRWVGFGIGVGTLSVIFGVLFAIIWFQTPSKNVVIGTKDKVFYSGSATEQQAKALGKSLKTIGYLTDRGVSVMLSKDKNGTVVGFVVKDGAWDNAEYISAFNSIARQIAPSVGGSPIKLRLLNSAQDTKREMDIR